MLIFLEISAILDKRKVKNMKKKLLRTRDKLNRNNLIQLAYARNRNQFTFFSFLEFVNNFTPVFGNHWMMEQKNKIKNRILGLGLGHTNTNRNSSGHLKFFHITEINQLTYTVRKNYTQTNATNHNKLTIVIAIEFTVHRIERKSMAKSNNLVKNSQFKWYRII